jgi:hypothetical protein
MRENPYQPPTEVNEGRAPSLPDTRPLGRIATLFLVLFVAYIGLALLHSLFLWLFMPEAIGLRSKA